VYKTAPIGTTRRSPKCVGDPFEREQLKVPSLFHSPAGVRLERFSFLDRHHSPNKVR